MPEEHKKAWVGIVLEALIISILSNVLFGEGIGEISCKYTLSYSPSNAAFGIWSLIYFTAFLSVFFQLQTRDCDSVCADSRTNLLFSVAWFFAALWTPAFVIGEGWSLVLACILLFGCASFSLAATMIEDAWRTTDDTFKRANGATLSLFAGWVTTAFALSLGIARQALLGRDQSDSCEGTGRAYNLTNSSGDPGAFPAPLLLAILVAVFGVWMKDPVLPLPPAWAIFWMKYTHYNLAAFLFLCCSTVVSLVRIFT